MRGGITREWVFDAAQTNLLLVDVASPLSGFVTYVDVTCAGSNGVDVWCRIGFHATTLPTYTLNSATGVPGMVFSHLGIKPGGGAVKANGGEAITVGGVGEGLRMSCSVPTGGFISVLVTIGVADPSA
jgi:hypothetical protein